MSEDTSRLTGSTVINMKELAKARRMSPAGCRHVAKGCPAPPEPDEDPDAIEPLPPEEPCE